MKTYVKIIILIATLGIGFGIGWFCRETAFEGQLSSIIGHEYKAEYGGESFINPGMTPSEIVKKVGNELMKL